MLARIEEAGGALRENGLSSTVVKVENEESAQKLGRPMGTYITLACEQAMTVSLETRRALAAELAQTLRGMLPPDMKTALVVGLGNRFKLRGSTMVSPDIRAGIALLIAAMSAEGTSTIHNIDQIDRGYQGIDKRLNRIGARITRI